MRITRQLNEDVRAKFDGFSFKLSTRRMEHMEDVPRDTLNMVTLSTDAVRELIAFYRVLEMSGQLPTEIT